MTKSLETLRPAWYRGDVGGDEMIHGLSWRIATYCTEGTDSDTEIVAYGLECRISDLVQVAMLAALGLTFRYVMEMLWFSVCFTALKRQVGGFHLASHFSCIGAFSVLAVAASRLAGQIPSAVVLPAMLAALALVIGRAPIAHPNHPKSKAAHKKSGGILNHQNASVVSDIFYSFNTYCVLLFVATPRSNQSF